MMKKLAFFVLILLLTGCTQKYPETANLNLQVMTQPAEIYSDGMAATIRGHDARENAAIVLYQIGDNPVVRIPNLSAPHIVISEQLVDGLQKQGLLLDSSAPVHILLEINELLVTVTKPEFLYETKAVSRITLSVKNKGNTIARKYKKEAKRETATRPNVSELETLLNNQLTDIVNRILQDEEIRETIRIK